MQSIITFITSLAFKEFIIVIILIFIMWILYIKYTDDDYYVERQNIKDQFQARLWEYLSGELNVIESLSITRAYNLIGLNDNPDDKKLQSQFAMYTLILERNIHGHLFETIKTAIRINGFHTMDSDELTLYITNKAEGLLRGNQNRLNQSAVIYFPDLIGTDTQRFTLEDSIKFYTRIVAKSKKLQIQEHREIIKLKKKYSIWHKINFVSKIISKFNKT